MKQCVTTISSKIRVKRLNALITFDFFIMALLFISIRRMDVDKTVAFAA